MSVHPLRPRPFHHLGYVVEDLAAAAGRFARTVGAGPFLHIGHVTLDFATYRGADARYDHRTAFGQWGPVLVELSVIEDAEPAELATFMGHDRPGTLGHVAWLVDDLEAESAALERDGLALVHTGGSGPVSAHWHDGGLLFGHPVEVLRRCPEILGLYAAVGAAAQDWDGSRPLRDLPVMSA
jgi:hypothetical protein